MTSRLAHALVAVALVLAFLAGTGASFLFRKDHRDALEDYCRSQIAQAHLAEKHPDIDPDVFQAECLRYLMEGPHR